MNSSIGQESFFSPPGSDPSIIPGVSPETENSGAPATHDPTTAEPTVTHEPVGPNPSSMGETFDAKAEVSYKDQAKQKFNALTGKGDYRAEARKDIRDKRFRGLFGQVATIRKHRRLSKEIKELQNQTPPDQAAIDELKSKRWETRKKLAKCALKLAVVVAVVVTVILVAPQALAAATFVLGMTFALKGVASGAKDLMVNRWARQQVSQDIKQLKQQINTIEEKQLPLLAKAKQDEISNLKQSDPNGENRAVQERICTIREEITELETEYSEYQDLKAELESKEGDLKNLGEAKILLQNRMLISCLGIGLTVATAGMALGGVEMMSGLGDLGAHGLEQLTGPAASAATDGAKIGLILTAGAVRFVAGSVQKQFLQSSLGQARGTA